MAETNQSTPRTRLPDFCGLPMLFALLLLAALVVLVMLLAPGSTLGIDSVGVATLFAVWLAVVCGVCLCKLRPRLERMAPIPAYSIVWLLIVLAVLIGSLVVWWLDHHLQTGLSPDEGRRFVVGNTAIAALVGAALLRYFYVLAQWQERLQAASLAQVEALQARIRPHFLFNSMNTVAALVRVDPDAAEKTVEDLSELFRAALGADERPGTLGEELDLIDRYLAIEQLRMGERLQIERDLSDAPRDLRLPPLLLQPLVENAIYHGIQPRREGGVIHLVCHQAGGVATLEIINTRDPDATPGRAGHGHALENVRHRLGYHYGDRASLEMRKEPDCFRVTVTIPIAEERP
ncbi:MAG: histidine kinase [Rhodanobacteraceae bacterium]